MELSVLVWTLFVIIAVEDLRRHRIPNVYLILILVVHSLELLLRDALPFVNVVGFGFLFTLGLIFFLLKALSPGDVKLLGVVGFVVGWPQILPASISILAVSGILGILSVLSNLSKQGVENPLVCFLDVKTIMNSSQNDLHSVYGNKLTMPFAPAVALGLAMFFYFY